MSLEHLGIWKERKLWMGKVTWGFRNKLEKTHWQHKGNQTEFQKRNISEFNHISHVHELIIICNMQWQKAQCHFLDTRKTIYFSKRYFIEDSNLSWTSFTSKYLNSNFFIVFLLLKAEGMTIRMLLLCNC